LGVTGLTQTAGEEYLDYGLHWVTMNNGTEQQVKDAEAKVWSAMGQKVFMSMAADAPEEASINEWGKRSKTGCVLPVHQPQITASNS
jgi:hypothetical protein